MFGGPPENTSPTKKLSWETTDLIEELRLWRNTKGDSVGSIKIKIAGKKDELAVGASNLKSGNVGTPMPLSGKMLLGVKGRAKSSINTLEFLFMKAKPKSVEMIGMDFPESLDVWNSQQKYV